MTTGGIRAHGAIAATHARDAPAAVEAGVWSPVGPGEVEAIADLLRRPPAQGRSVARVATILDIAAQATRDPDLTTTTLAERCGTSVGSIYQFFADLDAVLVCVSAVWMHRSVNATMHALVTRGPCTPNELARLLTSHLAAYRSRYRPPASSEAATRARADREREWHHQLAATLYSLFTRHVAEDVQGEQGPNVSPDDQRPRDEPTSEPSPLKTRCLTAVTLADQAARATAPSTTAYIGSHDPLASEMARVVALYIADAGLATPPTAPPASDI